VVDDAARDRSMTSTSGDDGFGLFLGPCAFDGMSADEMECLSGEGLGEARAVRDLGPLTGRALLGPCSSSASA